MGGITISNKKIQVLKFADDLVLIAKTPDEIQEMLREADKFISSNALEINTSKTKIMVCRKAGGLKKKEKWTLKGKEIEVVNEYKYLGFWIDARNNMKKHIVEMVNKTRKIVNQTWGLIKRAKVDILRNRLKLYETIAKSAGIYGVEIWGWAKRKEIERMQGRYIKMVMGLSPNTPDYIWKMEAGRRGIEGEARKRAARYLLENTLKEKNRWPRAALREEIRGILNGNPTKWGKELQQALSQAGDGLTLQLIWEEVDTEIIEKRLERNLRLLEDQETQSNWTKIDKSEYNENYKRWKTVMSMERYWEDKNLRGTDKETWARLRCGNIGKNQKRGFKDQRCRLCKTETESFEHIWDCRVAEEKGNKGLKERWNKWRANKHIDEVVCEVKSALSGEPVAILIEKAKEFEKLVRAECRTDSISEDEIENEYI